MVAQALSAKIIALASQVLLARLIAPADWGLYALALSIASFTTQFSQIGLPQVLMGSRFDSSRWLAAAFFLSLSASLITAAVLIFIAVLWTPTGNQQTSDLLIFVAADTFISTLSMVPMAALRRELRFGLLAAISLVASLFQAATAICLALLNLGVFSLLISKLMSGVFILALACWYSGNFLKSRKALSWMPLAMSGVPVTVAGLAHSITQQADYFFLALFADIRAVGLYFFAFNLSIQITALVLSNVQIVLLPALGKVDGHRRKVQNTVRAIRLLALLTIPVNIVVAAGADSIITTLFSPVWIESAPLLRILSFAAAFRLVVGPLSSLMLAQGQFQNYLWGHVMSAIVFVLSVGPLSYFAGAVGAAWGVLGYSMLYAGFFCLATEGLTSSDIWQIISGMLGSALATLIALAGAMAAFSAIPDLQTTSEVVKYPIYASPLLLGFALYLISIYVLLKKDVQDLAFLMLRRETYI